MTTKAPASVKEANPDDPVKKIYSMVDEFKDVIPIMNDRYRLAFNINKFFNGEAASIEEAVTSTNAESCTIEKKELIKQLKEKYEKLGLTK